MNIVKSSGRPLNPKALNICLMVLRYPKPATTSRSPYINHCFCQLKYLHKDIKHMYPAEARSAHDFMSGNASWKDSVLVSIFTLILFTFIWFMATKPRNPDRPKDTMDTKRNHGHQKTPWTPFTCHWVDPSPRLRALLDWAEAITLSSHSSSYRNLLAWVVDIACAL